MNKENTTGKKLSIEVMDVEGIGAAETWRMCPSPDSPRKSVKSTAVVKYSTVQSLANFNRLQCNTDLNLPPSNWLSSSAESYGLQPVASDSTGFSSFRMAHMFPDTVGEVDVISDAENIKKLLKIPYSKGPVSMMIHRIENTLLIDEFDIHKHLLRKAESEWEWLRKFFFENVLRKTLSRKERGLFTKNKSRCALQQKSLVSKFLYRSLAVPQGMQEDVPTDNTLQQQTVPVATAWPPLPEPTPEEKLPDPTSNHKFARNVVWTFEDIQMLIGTDMPIFGGATHPCISLRLRDMSKPINVLTGIDYWLDNLMCNVPELVMCYHLDGIVQKYELVKTEDLPHLDNSKFSPKVIRDVAQNILSFLKSNAAKAGHTYWLFKGNDDDVVKLYDLTSICSDVSDDKGQNPFTVPVAMLLYRVARNMKHSPDGVRQQGTIRMLLQNCVGLLAKEKYPQIVTSAHYMLSDVYVPADTDPANPGLGDMLEDEEEEPVGEEAGPSVSLPGERKDPGPAVDMVGDPGPSVSVAVQALCSSQPEESFMRASKCSSPPPQCGGLEERCKEALYHVAEGLGCLQYFDTRPTPEKKREEETPKMAHPLEAIPMPYCPLSEAEVKSKKHTTPRRRRKGWNKAVQEEEEVDTSPKALLCKSPAETLPTWQQPAPDDSAWWQTHLETLLYEKACLVYATLAEGSYAAERYGLALRHIGSVLHCLRKPSEGLPSYLIGRAGDACFRIVQDWARVDMHRQDLAWQDGDVKPPQLSSAGWASKCIPSELTSMEQLLLASCRCYQEALLLEPAKQEQSNLRRRLGNIENELGVLYMNQAAARYQEEAKEDAELKALFATSLEHLEAGVKVFETVRDEANLALLHSNTGRLMRVLAHLHSPSQRTELAGQERHFYNKALSSYYAALQVLGNRRSNVMVWDTVTWELSTTLFSMATLLQDYPGLVAKSQEEAEKEVIEFLLKALKYCDLDTPGPRQPVYQFRAASVHHKLASLYHKSFRSMSVEDSRRKSVQQLCRSHYEKAARLLLTLEHPTEFLRVQLERVALYEHQAQITTNFKMKLKMLQSALELLLQCRPILKVVVERSRALASSEPHPGQPPDAAIDEDVTEREEENSLLRLLEQRLQFVLRSLAKHCLANSRKEVENLSQVYKNLYSLTLRPGDTQATCSGLPCTLLTLVTMLEECLSLPTNQAARVRL